MKGSLKMTNKQYDMVGIGIGPFNLGLAALAEPLDEIDAVFFDKEEKFEWHPGMLIDGTDLQIPFLADLVTFADPTSPYSFLNYIHKQKRLYPFFFFNRFDIPRQEYNEYAKWVAEQLSSCHFSSKVVDVIPKNEEEYYEVKVETPEGIQTVNAKHVVMGTGSIPLVPPAFDKKLSEHILHSSGYLHKKEEIQKGKHVTIVGSGQSAAEIFLDLLEEQTEHHYHLTWFTRSSNFFQLDQSKLAQELFSPDYVDYFHSLAFEERTSTVEDLNPLRHGIESSTLTKIYDLLYHRSLKGRVPVTIQASTEVSDIHKKANGYELECKQLKADRSFQYEADRLILSTGYKPKISPFIERIKDDIEWEDDKRFNVTKDYRLVFKHPRNHHFFTLTNIEHSHGSGATNLGLSVQRNQRILNVIAGRDVYPVPEETTFQTFNLF